MNRLDANTPRADWGELYTNADLWIVPIQPGSKGPNTTGWNLSQNAFSKPAEAKHNWTQAPKLGMGLLHSESRTFALDVDHEEFARIAFTTLGFDLDAIIDGNPYRIKGRNGEKPIFRLPDDFNPKAVKLVWPSETPNPETGKPDRKTIFELRSGPVQDVLPPSIHPDTGLPYEWVGPIPKHRDDLPLIPAELLEMRENWNEYRTVLEAACPHAVRPETTREKPAKDYANTGSNDDVIGTYNDRVTVRDVLERNDYTRVSDARYKPAGSAHGAGVVILPGQNGKPERVFTHHASDVLAHDGGHDAFSAFCVLEHNGDAKEAVKAAAKLLGLESKPSSGGRTKTLADLGEDANPNEFDVRDATPPPELDDDALQGLAGDVVREVMPHTEAHAAAILLSFLVAVGVAIGNQISWNIGGTRHALRLFFVMVGISGKGRKGTSWGAIKRVLEVGLGDFMKHNLTGGMSTGEGLISAVRDPVTKLDKEGQEVLVDAGVEDKRMVVHESEFGRTLKVLGRDGNTLSAALRQFYEVGPNDVVRIMTKVATTATGPHVGIIAHITGTELLKEVLEVDIANGLVNRCVFATVHRSKLLPFGGDPDDAKMIELGNRLGQVIAWAQAQVKDNFGQATITWAAETRPQWAAMYGELTEGPGGLAGAVLSRAEAQVTRLAGLYAVLDKTLEVRPDHLTAAMALWQYSQESVFQIFGRRTGDVIADTILEGLKAQNSLTKTEVMALFGNNQSAKQIDTAVGLLIGEGRVRRVKGESKNGGRAPELLELIEVARG